MDFIKEVNYQLQIVKDHQMIWVDRPFVSYINQHLEPYLTTMMTQRKLLKKRFGFKNKVPILLDSTCILICIQSYRSQQAIYLNYLNIESWRRYGKKVIVTFDNGHEMLLGSYHSYRKQIKQIEQMLSNQDRIKIIF